MTTAEYIKMLQKADPSGTSHISLPDYTYRKYWMVNKTLM